MTIWEFFDRQPWLFACAAVVLALAVDLVVVNLANTWLKFVAIRSNAKLGRTTRVVDSEKSENKAGGAR